MMKRSSQALVAYSSSESDPDEPPKKRKLPSLSSSLVAPLPIDRPELHQGRIRSIPHVEGQWTAHIYVSVLVDCRSPLYTLLDDVLRDAVAIAPTLHPSLSTKRELHISLSRPTYLRAHQREDLKRAVKAVSKSCAPFRASFATFSELVNDERTRTFLTMEVGAGHHELQVMSTTLTPALKAIRQKEFYQDPRFHASIAWALLDRSTHPAPKVSTTSTPPSVDSATFETIPCLPKNLVSSLIERYGAMLAHSRTGTFDVEAIIVKIGKDAYSWPLAGL